MTNNNVGKTQNFGSIIYDSDKDMPNTRKRIGISATEIELLNDIPPPSRTETISSTASVNDQVRKYETKASSSSINQQPQQNNYQTLLTNREQPRSNVAYQSGSDPLNAQIDILLKKYAPEAVPQNVLKTTTNPPAPPPVNVATSSNQPSSSTFQTPAAPSAAAASNNYSIRNQPNNRQMPETRTPMNNNIINKNPLSKPSNPEASYDSFQHLFPAAKRRSSTGSVTEETNDKNVPEVVPGKLYALEDDPLHLFYDRQYPGPANSKPVNPQQPPSSTTFQPSNNFQRKQDPIITMFTNASQMHPQQTIPLTTNTAANPTQPFDLGNFIKRVQQDYQREIQPFVSSVTFVEKDHEYGQSLLDVGFVTPVNVRKGYTRQADDILRRSFGRQDHQQRSANNYDYSDDGGDNIEELRPPNRYQPLRPRDSRQSFTSVSSVSTTNSDYDDQSLSQYNRTNRANVRDQATSPPVKMNQPKPQPFMQNPPATSMTVPSKMRLESESDGEDISSGYIPMAPKLATRISSDQLSLPSEGSTLSDDEETYSAQYNELSHPEKSRPNPSQSSENFGPTTTPARVYDKATNEQNNTGKSTIQRSEDIHPTPPTIRPPQPNQASLANPQIQMTRSDSVGSESLASKSDKDSRSASEAEDKASTNVNLMPASTAARPNVQSISPSGPIRGAPVTSQTNTTVTRSQVPPPTTRGPTDNNARQPASGPTTNPNIHFVPPDQRSTFTDRSGPTTMSNNQPASTGGAAQTGSTRLFKSDVDNKASNKHSIKDGPATFGNKIKAFFRRK